MSTSKSVYTILGASGHVGGAIAAGLLAQGKTVRVVGRDPGKLQPLANLGAKIFSGSLFDQEFLAEAFRGARAAFVLTPPDYLAEDHSAQQLRTGEAISSALKGSSVSHVVNLSSYHANDAMAPRILLNLFLNEEKLNTLDGIQVLHLRPASFMENLLSNLPLVARGITGGMFPPEFSFPAVATKDIGDFAYRRLAELDFSGKMAADLLGKRDLSMAEITRVLASALGIPLHYVRFSAEETKKSMMSSGHIGESAANMLVEMNLSFLSGKLNNSPRTPSNTTPTSIEEFALVFKTICSQIGNQP